MICKRQNRKKTSIGPDPTVFSQKSPQYLMHPYIHTAVITDLNTQESKHAWVIFCRAEFWSLNTDHLPPPPPPFAEYQIFLGRNFQLLQ